MKKLLFTTAILLGVAVTVSAQENKKAKTAKPTTKVEKVKVADKKDLEAKNQVKPAPTDIDQALAVPLEVSSEKKEAVEPQKATTTTKKAKTTTTKKVNNK